MIASGSALGTALRAKLQSAGPIRASGLRLDAWLRALDKECSLPPPTPTTSAPVNTVALSLSPDYTAAFLSAFGSLISASDAVAAFSNGTLACS